MGRDWGADPVSNVVALPAAKLAGLPPDPAAHVIGHGTLASFHAGCHCGWCASASLERSSACCARCLRLRDALFVRPPDPRPKWWR